MRSKNPEIDSAAVRGTLRFSRRLKVYFDVFAAVVIMIALLPVFVIIALAVSLDGGPAFFGHTRIGLGGRKFRCLKFRSMTTDADLVLRHLLESDPASTAEWAATQKLRNDPRVTKVGKLLRATSLDELPQLFNVIRLDMSLVGPRPITSAEAIRYKRHIRYYYATRPGITGLWQISGRSNTTFARRVALDRNYVRDWSLGRDFYILAKTIPAVLLRQGAH